MANDVNKNAHSTTPGDITTKDIKSAPTGDIPTTFNHSNLITTEKVQYQTTTKNQNHNKLKIVTATPTKQHETTHQATQP